MHFPGYWNTRAIYSTLLIMVLILAGCSGSGQISNPTETEATGLDEFVEPTQPLASTPTIPPIKTLAPHYTPTPRLITPAPAEGTFPDQSMVSPDGLWTALPLFETLSDGYQVSLRVFNKDKSVVWTPVDYKGEGLGYLAPTPKRWSADSRYFYYAESTVSDGCSDFLPLEDSWKQLDILTGMVTPFELPAGRGHQFSPDETLLAYTTALPPLELVVRDVSTQTEKRVVLLPAETVDDVQGGRILWSPTGDELILAIQAGKVCEGQKPAYYLLVVHLEDMKLRTMYEGEDYLFPLTWDASRKILVKDWNSKSWWIDAVTGEITTAP